MPDQIETPRRYQCRHIFTDGHRCGSPCLRREEFCYYHHTTRRPIENPNERRARSSTFHLPLPEDRGAIQCAIGEVLQRIAANEIDPKRAGLLLYGLQIASLNLPKAIETKREPVEEIVSHPQYGTLAPQTEVVEGKEKPSYMATLLQELVTLYKNKPAAPATEDQPESTQPETTEPEPTTLPNLQACENMQCVEQPRALMKSSAATKNPALAGLFANQETGFYGLMICDAWPYAPFATATAQVGSGEAGNGVF
jgi:hypothetical protein